MASKKQNMAEAVADTNGWPVAFAPLKKPVHGEKKEESLELESNDD